MHEAILHVTKNISSSIIPVEETNKARAIGNTYTLQDPSYQTSWQISRIYSCVISTGYE